MAESENFRGGSLVDWRRELEPRLPALATELHEVPDPYAVLEGMGLPFPVYLAFDLVTDFLDDPESYLKLLEARGVEQFYVGLRPKIPDLKKYRELGLAHNQVEPYVRDHIHGNEAGYHLRIGKYTPAEYGAVMIINPSGALRLEMVHGEMSNLATGTKTPEFSVETDPFNGVMRYSFDNTELRESVWQAIRSTNHLPGYYEFPLIRRAGRLTPTFFDYKPNPIYTVPE